MQGFLAFLKQYSIIGLAIAVIIGGKLNELVNSLVNDLLVPILFQPVLRELQVDDIRKLSYHGILYGKVVGASIDFMIVALCVYAFAKVVLREQEVAKR